MIQPLPVSYNARWESLPDHLRPQPLTTLQKVRRCLSIITLIRPITYCAGYFARRLILTASTYSKKELLQEQKRFRDLCNNWDPSFEITPYSVVTPDGATLSVHFFRHRLGRADTPTTVYLFGSNGHKGQGAWDWLLTQSKLRSTPMNIVLFHYRSVDRSTGKFRSTRDLLVDCASVIDWLRKAIQIPDDQINLYGISLGGALAVKTMAADEKLTGWIVNERSFSNLEEFIKAQASKRHCLLKPLAPLVVAILKHQNLEIDAAADLPKLKGRKLFVYHARDPLIHYPASIALKIPEHACQLMEEKKEVQNHQSEPLDSYLNSNRISNFVFNQSVESEGPRLIYLLSESPLEIEDSDLLV